jgi:hypothetical protein
MAHLRAPEHATRSLRWQHNYTCLYLRNRVLSASGCLTLAAGASFETRHTHNSYSFVTLDLVRAQRTVKTIQYHPASGAFAFASSEDYPIEIAPSGTCSVGELAKAMKAYRASLSPLAHYLSAGRRQAAWPVVLPHQKMLNDNHLGRPDRMIVAAHFPRPSPFLCAMSLQGIDRPGMPSARRH